MAHHASGADRARAVNSRSPLPGLFSLAGPPIVAILIVTLADNLLGKHFRKPLQGKLPRVCYIRALSGALCDGGFGTGASLGE
jgi:hypothetical protein